MTGSQRQRRSQRIKLALILLIVTGGGSDGPATSATPTVVHDAGTYFPDQTGNEWRYRGRITEGTVNQIAETTFVNVSTVTGRTRKDGVLVTVIHDTNPGDQGPTDSYYLRDAAGIRYYGSKPGTKLERQLIPYQIVRFPLELTSSFQQLDRNNLNLGLDIDHDGLAETVDVQSTVTVHGEEPVTVPFGTYDRAIRLESRMNLLVHLSRDGTRVHGFDAMTVWLVKGVGLVKYIERQLVPMVRAGKERLIEITEELEDATLHGRSPSPPPFLSPLPQGEREYPLLPFLRLPLFGIYAQKTGNLQEDYHGKTDDVTRAIAF